MINNETKRDVFETIADKSAGYNDKLYEKLLREYDDALPDNLPVIPDYVAEYIDMAKNGKTRLHNTDVIQASIDVMEYGGGSIELTTWLDENGDTFARAWLDGYQVEEG